MIFSYSILPFFVASVSARRLRATQDSIPGATSLTSSAMDGSLDNKLICPSKEEILGILNQIQPDGIYGDELRCDYDYVFTSTTANDLNCVPTALCSFNAFGNNTWTCTMASILCNPIITDPNYLCGEVCIPVNEDKTTNEGTRITADKNSLTIPCPRTDLIINQTINECPSYSKKWPKLVGICGSDAKAWLEQQYIDTGICEDLEINIVNVDDGFGRDYRFDRIRVFVEKEENGGNELVVLTPYVG